LDSLHLKALVVEDDPDVASVLSAYLAVRGHEVTLADDAERALDLYRDQGFPLLILDWMLPGMNGLDLCRRIRQSPDGDTPVILMVTGRGDPRNAAAALEAGANDFLPKPFTPEMLEVRLTVAERQVEELKALKLVQEDLAHKAMHDPLTALPNRLLFQDRLDQAIRLATRNNSHLAVLLLDLDGFKAVNDTFGHACGDLVLQALGARLAVAVRASDTVARIGGDEFALLMPAGDRDGAGRVAAAILEGFREPFALQEVVVSVGASIGIALYPEHASDGASLLRMADAAMYRAKRVHGSYEFYDPPRDARRSRRLA
jgi:diguanylate cyclase (GGDEF)-like protein